MKARPNVLLILSILLISSVSWAQTARGVRIGYVDMEYILENVEEYRQASDQLDAKVKKWKVEIEQKQAVVDQMKQDLMAEKVLLTPELITEREEEIQILEKEMIEYQQNRFGPQGDLVLQKRLLIQPIQDQVFNAVQKIGGNKRYDFIFDKSADVVMLYAQQRHDISDLVLRDIARTRKVSKRKGGDGMEQRLKEFQEREGNEVEEVPSEALIERQEKAKQAADARAKTADERRAQQLKLREERKKAYQERRKKLLEEREARRKKEQEEKENKKNKEDGEEDSKD
ncbi:MAG: OmpH family outer membrane protein [Flavobacteriaceae bacterium]